MARGRAFTRAQATMSWRVAEKDSRPLFLSESLHSLQKTLAFFFVLAGLIDDVSYFVLLPNLWPCLLGQHVDTPKVFERNRYKNLSSGLSCGNPYKNPSFCNFCILTLGSQ
jgi:hypothetical protein